MRFLQTLTAALFLTLSGPALAQTPLDNPLLSSMRQVPTSQMEVQLSYAPVVSETAPAVVNIFTSRTVRTRARTTGSDFFDRMLGMGQAPQERTENSLGSGVIVRSNGTIVTNAHVIRGADELRVVLNDRREFAAQVIAQDEDLDIAVLQIEPDGEALPTLRLQMDGDREIGDIVLAIGNPFGVGQTVTSGIISALGRTNVSNSSSFIQTDAAVNPGNSGGALVNLSGELIGVNTAIFSRSGGSNGIGFAIPAELVGRAVDSALSTGEIVRPWIGARTDAVDTTMAAALGLDRARGAVINELLPDGPADAAGLEKGDVILSIDGNAINDDSGLRFTLATLKNGDRARIAYMREGRERSATVRIETPQENPARDERQLLGIHPLDGAVVVNMSPALGEELGFDPYLTGVMVLKVQRRTAANVNRIRPGDFLISINGRDVRSTRDAERIFRDEQGSPVWDIEVERGGRRGILPVRVLPDPS
ncbi:Do family serine endopeptidase [Algimonas porphyrae]|uniref:Serine protease n=1 Tax=Algimonas porphyrae TaxID=1128113 RepID=A0ABQ5V2S8_9PROT|nr:Do family serine endopeptidase [Algimonas porphyrae]GLQ21840.1 serine protease [Algimonas porphyrae]